MSLNLGPKILAYSLDKRDKFRHAAFFSHSIFPKPINENFTR